MSTNCRICRVNPIARRPETPPNWDLCADCANTLGVRPLPPPCRPARPCMRCDRMEFVRVIPREVGGDRTAPQALTMHARIVEGIFGGIATLDPDIRDGAGFVETYVCTTCGFVEWYCLSPKTIPLGPEFMADLVTYTTDGPFR